MRDLSRRGWYGLVSLCTVIGALLAMSASAFAVPPEAPELEVTSRQATSASLTGILNPGKEGEGGTYEFLYRASASECKGGSHAPETPGLSLGREHEEVFEQLSGLEPATKYTVCLRVENTANEVTVGPATTFTTALPPEAPTTRPATNVGAGTATFNGTLNPNRAGEAGTYQFVYRASATECQGEGGMETSPQPASGQQNEAVSTVVTGLLPSTTYAFCLVARNMAEETVTGAPETFTTPPVSPSITDEAVSGITSTEATLSARIDPGGASASYVIDSDLGDVLGVASLPAASVPVDVRQTLGGLTPATEYHVHFVVHNAQGEISGGVLAFSTRPERETASTLPDGRAYELVSSASNQGEVYVPAGSPTLPAADAYTKLPFRAADSGDAIAFAGDPEPNGGNGSAGLGLGNEYMARRGPGAGPTGWESTAITPRPSQIETAREGQLTAYESFSDDLSTGFLRTPSRSVAVAAEPKGPDNCWVMYSHTTSDNRYHALFDGTQTPGDCGAPEGFYLEERFRFAGVSGDGSQALFQTQAALAPGATKITGEGNNLYASQNGTTRLVSVLPSGGAAVHATFGAPSLETRNPPGFSHVISGDGAHVVWSVEEAVEIGGEITQQPAGLYVRENVAQPPSPVDGTGRCTVAGDACTVQVDAAEGGAPGPSGGGRFWTANDDGTKIFFTDCRRLTPRATAVSANGCERIAGPFGGAFEQQTLPTGQDLYEYDFTKPLGERLADLTVDNNPADLAGADVQGVVGTSDDGSYVYFVAGSALQSSPNARGELPTARTCERAGLAEGELERQELHGHLPSGKGCNLYVWHVGSPLRFIASLSAGDDALLQSVYGQRSGDWTPDLGSRTAQVSSDGTHLVFESTLPLTGYDNSALGETAEGQGGLEVFAFDAAANRLSCASCDPTGAAPDATFSGAATHLPTSLSGTFTPRWMSDTGTEIFYDTSQPLVSQDTNQAQDVYEWEAEGTSSCPARPGGRPDNGCVFLLSGGEDGGFSYFVDASADGNDVFLTHRGPLGQAGPRDEKNHLYDVRVDGGFRQISTACAGAGCQGAPPAPPLFATPSSVTFNGSGNFPPPAPSSKPKPKSKAKFKCKRGLVKKHGRCIKKSRRKKTKVTTSSRGGKS